MIPYFATLCIFLLGMDASVWVGDIDRRVGALSRAAARSKPTGVELRTLVRVQRHRRVRRGRAMWTGGFEAGHVRMKRGMDLKSMVTKTTKKSED
jgi:hypothetical protein